jgi:hypothetical protein
MRAVRLVVALLLFAGVARLAPAGDEKIPKFENLPAGTEVHAVTVYQPRNCGVDQEEITDYQALIKALRAKEGMGVHVRKFLPNSVEKVLTDDAEMGRGVFGDAPNPRLARREATWWLARALDSAVRGKVLYDKEAFAKVELPKAVKELIELGEKRTVFQTARLNRDLLALAFPASIAPTPDHFQTADVTVKAGKPVVLVFSSSDQCRWKVTVEKGAKVVGVVLFGGYAQDITGADAPVIYAATTLPNGKRGPFSIGSANKQEGKTYERILAAVKEMTGRDFTTFQGQNAPGLEPFVVKPSAR